MKWAELSGLVISGRSRDKDPRSQISDLKTSSNLLGSVIWDLRSEP